MADWHYFDKKGDKIGPISTQALKVLAAQGFINRNTVIVNNNGRIVVAGEVKGLTFPEATVNSSVGTTTGSVSPSTASIVPPPVLPTPQPPASPPPPPPPVAQDVYALNTASTVILPPPSRILSPSDASGAGAGTSPKSDVDEKVDKKGSTRLHTAASNNDTNLIGILLQAGATIGTRDRDGRTPLHVAGMAGKLEALAALLAAGAEIDAEDNEGKTPLHAAVAAGKMKAVDVLVRAGANVDTMDKDGRTLLYSAAVGGRLEAVAELLKGRIHANADGEDERTLLYCPKENEEAASALLPSKTNIDISDGQQLEVFIGSQDSEQYGFVFQSVGNAVVAFLILVLVIGAIAVINHGITVGTAIGPFIVGSVAFFVLRTLAVQAGSKLFLHRFFLRAFGLYFCGVAALILLGVVLTYGPGVWQSAVDTGQTVSGELMKTAKQAGSLLQTNDMEETNSPPQPENLQEAANQSETEKQPVTEVPLTPQTPSLLEKQPETERQPEPDKPENDEKPANGKKPSPPGNFEVPDFSR